MIVLAVHGSYGTVSHDLTEAWPSWFFHDAAAVLLKDGNIVYATEEERLTRIKHTNKFPILGVRHALAVAGVSAADVTFVAVPIKRDFADEELRLQQLEHPGMVGADALDLTIQRLFEATGHRFDPDQIIFVRHHDAHARMAFHDSGYEAALVAVVDGQGEDHCASIYACHGSARRLLKTYTEAQSIGHLYSMLTQFLGYTLFDEYKTMGLAPYGDPLVFADLFQQFATLLPDGEYHLDRNGLRRALLADGLPPRRKGDAFNQKYRDLAAALQITTERIVIHVLRHWQTVTGLDTLCLVGGVAHNCSLNGKIHRLGLFKRLFVHSAAHDAGAATGAALEVYDRQEPKDAAGMPRRSGRRVNPFLGDVIASNSDLPAVLARWRRVVDARRSPDVVNEAAELLASGLVLAWVQGRAEFGPRALGNRSIVADPRPAANKSRINAMIKKREAYRPFAPAVLAERAADYFDLPDTTIAQTAYMNITAMVRREYRQQLGAITHVDGTARLQTVAPDDNALFYDLIRRFGDKTGVPILLNTSFNNNAEPIVNDVDDAVQCLLTTSLDALVVGDHIVTRRSPGPPDLVGLVPALALGAEVRRRTVRKHGDEPADVYEARWAHKLDAATPLSPAAYGVLVRCDGATPLAAMLAASSIGGDGGTHRLAEELYALWEARLVHFRPVPESTPVGDRHVE